MHQVGARAAPIVAQYRWTRNPICGETHLWAGTPVFSCVNRLRCIKAAQTDHDNNCAFALAHAAFAVISWSF